MPTQRNPNFGTRLRAILRERSMSQADLARAVGLPRDRISHYCNGGFPRPQKLAAIAKALDMDVRVLEGSSATSPVAASTSTCRVEPTEQQGRMRLFVDAEMSAAAAFRIAAMVSEELEKPTEPTLMNG